MPQVQHQIADANIELEEAEHRHSEITNPLSFRLSDILAIQTEAMKANQELFDSCGDPELWKQWDQTIAQQNENIARNRDLQSEISMLDRKAQNAALRAEHEISRSDIDRLTTCQVRAILNNAVVAFCGIHDLPPSERAIVSWGGSNNLDSIDSASRIWSASSAWVMPLDLPDDENTQSSL